MPHHYMSKPAESSFTEYVIHTVLSTSDWLVDKIQLVVHSMAIAVSVLKCVRISVVVNIVCDSISESYRANNEILSLA